MAPTLVQRLAIEDSARKLDEQSMDNETPGQEYRGRHNEEA